MDKTQVPLNGFVMEEQHPKCPKCGSSDVARILYGLPDDSEELRQELDAKQVVLGGCVVSDDDPQFHCNDCHHDWRPE